MYQIARQKCTYWVNKKERLASGVCFFNDPFGFGRSAARPLRHLYRFGIILSLWL